MLDFIRFWRGLAVAGRFVGLDAGRFVGLGPGRFVGLGSGRFVGLDTGCPVIPLVPDGLFGTSGVNAPQVDNGSMHDASLVRITLKSNVSETPLASETVYTIVVTLRPEPNFDARKHNTSLKSTQESLQFAAVKSRDR